MKEKINFAIGDLVRMKKPHPCGSNIWKIYRIGMDFGLTCQGCGHHVMMPRPKFEKMAMEKLSSGTV